MSGDSIEVVVVVVYLVVVVVVVIVVIIDIVVVEILLLDTTRFVFYLEFYSYEKCNIILKAGL